MSMTEQGVRLKPEIGPAAHPIAEFNQRFDFQFSTVLEEHDADRRTMMVDYARELGAPELAKRLELLFAPIVPPSPVAQAGFGLPSEVLDCLESKFGGKSE